MRLVTWNCNGRLRDKASAIKQLDADVYIIQECENPIESRHKEYIKRANNYLWIGDTKNKGLGVFAKPEIELQKLDWTNEFKTTL